MIETRPFTLNSTRYLLVAWQEKDSESPVVWKDQDFKEEPGRVVFQDLTLFSLYCEA